MSVYDCRNIHLLLLIFTFVITNISCLIFNDRFYTYVGLNGTNSSYLNLSNSSSPPPQPLTSSIDVNDDNNLATNSLSGTLSPVDLMEMNEVFTDPEEFMKRFVDFGSNGEDSKVEDNNHISVSYLTRGYGAGGESTGEGKPPEGDPVTTDGRRKTPKTSPAGCGVEMRTVEIKDRNHELYYPWCVRLARCSGCCPSTRLKCVPTNISIVDIAAVKIHFVNSNQKFKYDGMRVFKMEKHESCSCECVQQSQDCNEYQIYRPEECRCVCRNPDAAADCISDPKKHWMAESCRCLCKTRKTCMTGTIFSQDTCRCEVESSILMQASKLNRDNHQVMAPLSPIHTVDVEFKKQQDRHHSIERVGSSQGINPDTDNRLMKIGSSIFRGIFG